MNPSQPNVNDQNATTLGSQAPTLGSQAPTAGSASSEPTAGGPTDATMIRTPPSAPTVPDMPNANKFGKYELLGEVARGGMGVVHRARQHGLDRTVALKMILGTGISQETAQRFLQEARAAAALDHPNVVPIYDIGEIDNSPYFTMALVDGPNLRGHVDAMGVVPIPVAVALFAQIVAGVAHAHHHGIIHRDLKPANVLIDKDGRPRVTDFGLAKRASAESQLTVTGQVVGTPSYMAPEQARESKDVGPPADVYSLGAILYFLLTGRPPFTGEGVADLLIKVVSEAPVPPSQLRPGVPVDLEALCLRCLAKKPEERFATADELSAALAPIADQHLSASAGLAPSLARIGLSRTSSAAFGSVPDLTPTTNSGPFANGPSMTAPLPTSPEPAPAPMPAPNRRPLLIGLGAVVVLLIGAVAFFATRGPKKDEIAKQDPPPATNPEPKPANPEPKPADQKPATGQPAIVQGSTITKGPEVVQGPMIVTPAGTNDGDKGWPTATRADFGLKVDVEAPTAKKDADGVIRVAAGSPLTLRLKADKDCRVAVWLVEANGDVTRLFPNKDDADDRLTAGKERVVPGNDGYILETTPTEGTGLDRLRVFATTGELPALPPGAPVGRFSVYTGAEGERLASAIRGVVLKKAGGGATDATVSEAEIRFRVQK